MAKSIKLGSDTYLDESDVMLDSSSSSRKTIAQARSAVNFSITIASGITITQNYSNCYYNPLTKEVHLHVFLYSTDQTIPGRNAVIATVPSAYKPSALVNGTAQIYTDETYPTKASYIERAYVNSNGEICCAYFLVGSAMKIFVLDMTYPL